MNDGSSRKMYYSYSKKFHLERFFPRTAAGRMVSQSLQS